MNDPRPPRIVFLVMLLMAILQWVRVYPLLPPKMASHFDFNGTPNGWQSKEAFFTVMIAVIALSTVIGFLIPLLMASLPDNLINLPHKAYWLAPERREESYRLIGTQMGWFSCALLFVLLYATWQAIKVSLPEAGHFNSQGMMEVLAGFLLLSVLGTVRFVRHFYTVPDYSSSSSPGTERK